MAQDAITTTGPTITVSNSGELKEAYDLLANMDGGGTILMDPGFYGEFVLNSSNTPGGNEPVIIASADEANPAEFTRISLHNVENIRIEDIFVDSTGVERPNWHVDLSIEGASNIQIADSTFVHDTDNALKDAGARCEDMSLIRYSNDIVFENNYVDGYFHALKMSEIQGVEITNNELTNMQGDGIRGGGWQEVLIQGNYFHDFYGTDQTLNHSDLIQIWGSDSDTLTQNVTITENIMLTDQAASQSIFIRNEEFGDAGDPTSGYFQNITVTDNLIYNAHKWGIHVADTQGVLIDGNTVLWNPDAVMMVGGEPRSYLPEIFTRNASDVTATNNIVSEVRVPEGETAENNQILSFDDPADPNFVGAHFVNPLVGLGADLRDLYMLPDSSWYDTYGAWVGYFPSQTPEGLLPVFSSSASDEDQYEITFSAQYSLDESGFTSANSSYSYHWTFEDGTTAEGLSVVKVFESGDTQNVSLDIRLNGESVADITRSVLVQTKDVFALDFEDGVVDISDSGASIDGGAAKLVTSHDGQGVLIGDGSEFTVWRDAEGLTSSDTFGLALDLQPTGDEQSGVFLYMHNSMSGSITSEGRFSFSLTTDEGSYSLTSREPIFDDGEVHRIGVAFDGSTGQLELFADGESVSSTEAWGSTAPAQYWNLIFGNAWADSMDALIDNVEMSVDPSIAGNLPQIDPPSDEEPPVNEEPPIDEEPPVNEEPPEDTDPGDRTTPPELVESSGSSNFLSELLDVFLRIFGLGRDDDPAPTSAAAQVSDATLSDVIQFTESLSEADAEETDVDESEEDFYFAA